MSEVEGAQAAEKTIETASVQTPAPSSEEQIETREADLSIILLLTTRIWQGRI